MPCNRVSIPASAVVEEVARSRKPLLMFLSGSSMAPRAAAKFFGPSALNKLP
jgi:hypothetical protein